MERGSSAPDHRAGPRSASATARSRVWIGYPSAPDRRLRPASASVSALWRPQSPWKAIPLSTIGPTATSAPPPACMYKMAGVLPTINTPVKRSWDV
ncbi:hypothetical protein ZEAMMB73_Zm00001d014508 [Zea mays]|uniref:Uncharacterized protein n=1 Tax=Zea mays TaxID=4577 RepID=A0A1D6GTV3_MAIZE|nr:hypothetical protein ZEAMMB73_Zm00001d014508 [Zea mays]AQK66419.1 hypothetical protein ZEAMMB73_Zm00001d014508 [Zea mays]